MTYIIEYFFTLGHHNSHNRVSFTLSKKCQPCISERKLHWNKIKFDILVKKAKKKNSMPILEKVGMQMGKWGCPSSILSVDYNAVEIIISFRYPLKIE